MIRYLLFFRVCVNEIIHVLEDLKLIKDKINLHYISKLIQNNDFFFSKNVYWQIKYEVIPMNDLSKYWGVPISRNKVIKHIYSFITDKVKKKLNNWKFHMFFYGTQAKYVI